MTMSIILLRSIDTFTFHSDFLAKPRKYARRELISGGLGSARVVIDVVLSVADAPVSGGIRIQVAPTVDVMCDVLHLNEVHCHLQVK